VSGEQAQPRQDRQGYTWLPAGEPGEDKWFCYDAPARRRMGDKWRVMTRAEAEAEFGPLSLLVAVDREQRTIAIPGELARDLGFCVEDHETVTVHLGMMSQW
jgi:hypothetical protein